MTWQERIAKDQEARAAQNAQRRSKTLWDAKLQARVTHPKHGEVVVPCHSPLAAQECAAEVWGTTWSEIHKEAKVTAL